MSASAVRMGKAFVELGTKLGPQFDAGLKAAGARLKSFGASVTKIGSALSLAGASVLAPLTAAVTKFASAGSTIHKIAAQTGNSVGEVSKLTRAAAEVGVEIDDMVGSMEELNIRLGEAVRDGAGPLFDTFQKLGIDAREFAALPVTEQYEKLADVLAGIEDRSQRQFVADEIFGGDAFKILPLLEQGGEALAETLARVSAMSEAEAASAAALTKTWNQLSAAVNGVVMAVGGALAPAITALLEAVMPIIQSAAEWIKNNQQLVIVIAGVAAGVLLLGTGLIALGGIATAAGIVLSGLTAAVSLLGTVLGIVLSPVGLIVAGIIGIATWAVYASGVLNGLGSIFGEMFSGIMGALGSGNLELAGEIAMLGLQAIWARVWRNLQEIALDTMDWIASKFRDWAPLRFVAERMGMDIEAGMKGLELARQSADREVSDAEKALRIAVDRANTTVEEEQPDAPQAAIDKQDPLAAAIREATEAQNEAAAAQLAAVDAMKKEAEGYVPGGDDAAQKLSPVGATNSAAAAMLAAGKGSEEIQELRAQTKVLLQIHEANKKTSAIYQMAERNGWDRGVPITTGQ